MTQFKTFTDAERAALKQHGLSTDGPSQLSDAFVLGMRYAFKQPTQHTVYRPCEAHKHLPVTLTAIAIAAVRVCPHCPAPAGVSGTSNDQQEKPHG